MNDPLITFWGLAGLLTVMAVLGLLWPIAARRPAAAGDVAGGTVRRAAWPLAVLIPVLASCLYLQLGAPRTLQAAAQPPAHRQNETDMASAVEGLARRLKAQPEDLQGWFMLARSYQAMERWSDAAAAYREALRLAPDEPQLLSDLADVLATARSGDLEGEPRALLERALRADPRHAKSLALSAMAEFRQARFAAAIEHWEHLLASQPAGSEGASVAQRGIEQARALMARNSK